MNRAIKSIGVFGNPDKTRMSAALAAIAAVCARTGTHLVADRDLAAALPAGVESVPADKLVEQVDLGDRPRGRRHHAAGGPGAGPAAACPCWG